MIGKFAAGENGGWWRTERILAARAVLEGERKQLTVLFANEAAWNCWPTAVPKKQESFWMP